MRYFRRTLEDTIRSAMRYFPAILVTGPRQSGKTTMLRHGWEKSHRFVSLEQPAVRERAIRDPEAFFRDYPPPLILDEIQYAPVLLHHVKTMIDENRKPGQWLMTGSQGFPAMRNVSQSLAGRVAVLTLLPFSFGEYSGVPAGGTGMKDLIGGLLDRNPGIPGKRTGPRRDLGDWILRGGYPELWAKPGMDAHLWCASYVNTYLERDVRSLIRIGDLSDFGRFVRLCAARTAQVLNLSNIARDAGVTVMTVKKWLSVLEASFQVFLLPPYFTNISKRLIKAPKMYFTDTAVAAYLTGIREKGTAMEGPMAGALVETAVVTAWRKAFLHRGLAPTMHYWRTRDGWEVDLLVSYDGKIHPMEVKAAATLTPRHGAGVEQWLERYGKKGERGLVFGDIDEPFSLGGRVSAMPWNWV